MAAITRRTAKPTDSPTTTCCTSVPSAWAEAMLTTVCSPSTGCAQSATRKASPTLSRMGMAFWENTGAAVNSASTRTKGQISGESQAAIWASLKEIIPPNPECSLWCDE